MNLWFAQILAVIRLEWKKTFFARRGFWIYILALMPLTNLTQRSLNGWPQPREVEFHKVIVCAGLDRRDGHVFADLPRNDDHGQIDPPFLQQR